MAESSPRNGATRPLAQALAIATLMAAFTGLFIPLKRYADHQDEMAKEIAELRTRITVLETRVELFHPPATK